MKLRLLQCDLFLSKKNRRVLAFSVLVAIFCATASFGTLWSYSGTGAWVPPVQGALYEPYPTITVPLEAVVGLSAGAGADVGSVSHADATDIELTNASAVTNVRILNIPSSSFYYIYHQLWQNQLP